MKNNLFILNHQNIINIVYLHFFNTDLGIQKTHQKNY